MEQSSANVSKFIQTILSNPGYVSALLALVGLVFTWRKFREDSLRRNEVLDWANEAIASLEGLVLVILLAKREAFAGEARQRLAKIAFESAILVERGRIFFKNKPHGNFGAQKKPAYRGLRPRILDPLIAANQIAIGLPNTDSAARLRMKCVAEDYLKDFVSLIQVEIGRQRTASLVTQEGGSGFKLQAALDSVSPERLARADKKPVSSIGSAAGNVTDN